MHPVLFFVTYIGLTVAPLAFSYAQRKPPRPFWDELSSGLALASFAILLVEFLLSGRFHSLSKRLGMDVTMRFHQLLARTAAAFLLVHPFLYTVPTVIGRPDDVTGLDHLGLTGPTIISGLIAWFLLMALVITAIFRDRIGYSYEGWRAMHAVGAVLVVGLSAHHALLAGRYSADLMLGWFWAALLAVAAGTIILVYLVRPLGRLRNPYVVDGVRKIALKTWEVDLKRERGNGLRFAAGQFAWVRVGCSPFSLRENPFSIASAPADRSRLSFVIKEQGDFTSHIGQIAPGTAAYVDGPYGNLTLAGRRADGIGLIAGGVGIAPLLSVLRQLQNEKDRRPIVLVYGNRCREQIIYDGELHAMTQDLDLTIHHVLSEPPNDWSGRLGMIDREVIRELFCFAGSDRWCYFLCGPPPMIDATERALLELGIPDRQVVSERFNYD